ncbi:unnamed protein product, partial [marine sediment metagenome]
MEGTPDTLRLIESLMLDPRDQAYENTTLDWVFWDIEGYGWDITKALVNSGSLEGNPDGLVAINVDLRSWWFTRTQIDAAYDPILGTAFSVLDFKTPAAGRVAGWETSLAFTGVVDPHILGWSCNWQNNYQTTQYCRRKATPQAPQVYSPGELTFAVSINYLGEANKPPPATTAITVGIRTASITIPYCERVTRGIPLSNKSTPHVWNVSYRAVGNYPV